MTRSIMIASEEKDATLGQDPTERYNHFASGFYGGHTLVRQGVKQYQVQGVEFYQLGQGGVIGRYPIHFHMARKVPQEDLSKGTKLTYVADSSIHDSNTRFITVHATQGVLLARNVGYKSIGHGFYLEDATEINNRLYSNIGITSRAAVFDDLNPRSIPGIIARTGDSGQEVFPYHSDWDHPSVFWIMNTWNDFRYNVAVGAGTCGACYWMPPSEISGLSVYETWNSYAGMQTSGRGGVAPLMNFVGNSCSTAMNSLETVGDTAVCNGVSYAETAPSDKTNWLVAVSNAAQLYPTIDAGLRQHATVCNQEDCSTVPTCTGEGENEANCAATVIDHYTTSFNWASTNFAAVWLRGWWYLMQNSAITDSQSAGFTAITGGGYTRADVAQGFWNLSLRNIFVGNTQPNNTPCMLTDSGYPVMLPANAAASNAGPFNPCAIASCPFAGVGNSDHCVSKADDISMPIGPFANAQRLFSIYDGPVFEDSDVFADINPTDVGTLEQCKKPVGGVTIPGTCQKLGFMNAFQAGVLQYPSPSSDDTKLPPTPVGTNHCILPNAAIAWKQPNGFYYPPAFHSKNLAFNDVQIRHYVVEPPWLPNSFTTNVPRMINTYCSWLDDTFGNNFTDIDRQTELSDDDGALTGLVSQTQNQSSQDPSISVNKDAFFNAPLFTPECSSSSPGGTYQDNATADTSPYQYVSTVIYPDCTTGGGCGNWGPECTNQSCYGVPLFRHYLTNDEYTKYQENPASRPVIRLMGQVSIQRSNLTLNHGSYYIDTTVSASNQPVGNQNVFKTNQTYYVFFPYAAASATEPVKTLHQTYRMYIGKVSQSEGDGAVKPARVKISSKDYVLSTVSGNWITESYDTTTGILTVTIDLSGETDVFENDRQNFCQPASFCTYDQNAHTCGCAPGNPECVGKDNVCSWGIKDIDCPSKDGCFGFAVTVKADPTAPGAPSPPAPILFTGNKDSTLDDPYFKKGNVSFINVDSTVSGPECRYPTPPVQQESRELIRW
ncbi:MAG: hypothetical protein JOZ83_00035 [Silvibacterium sp.]|nr:hypothetical protein [Silvibacterium sp.]